MTHTTRQWFSTLLMAALLSTLPIFAFAAAAPSQHTANRLYLELDGALAGPLRSSEGGIPVAAIVQDSVGADNIVHKHLGALKYGDITITFSGGMAKPVYQWMQEALAGKNTIKSGAIIFTDFNGTEVKRLNFYNALIAQIGFPALDASNKEALFFTLKLTPETTRPEKGKGGKYSQTSIKQEAATGFKLAIAGLDTSRVGKIEAMVAMRSVSGETYGSSSSVARRYGKVDLPNLVIEITEASSKSTVDWFNDFVVNGNSSQNKEKTGTLEFLSPSGVPLFILTLGNLGIFKLEPGKVPTGADGISRVQASMYCETMQFSNSGK